MRVVSMASSSVIGGSMVGMRLASMVFPAPGGTNEENVVATGAGDFQRALGSLLAMDVAQVHGILRRVIQQLSGVDFHRSERLRRIHQIDRLRQRLDAEDFYAVNDCSF